MDQTGAPLAGAQITFALAGASSPTVTVRTDAGGEFTTSNLAPGTYVVRAEASGFRPTERRVAVNATARVRLDIGLQLGFAEAVAVRAEAGQDALPKDMVSDTGSRLGLTARELPASLEIVPRVVMQARGQRTVGEAIESAVGVTVGDSPGNPTNFSTRGFTNNQVSILHDGLRVGPPSMVSRPLDVWNLERVEVLKGPASALFGEGAVGGAVNYVFKRPQHTPQRAEGELSYGGFNTARLGLGAGGPLGRDTVNYRVDYSLNHTDGFIDRTPQMLHSLTSAVLWDISGTLDLQVSFDVLDDDISPYWGTPIVPATFAREPIDGVVRTTTGDTIDRRMSRVNYNVSDNVMDSTTTWTRAKSRWRPTTHLALQNEVYYLNADREWKNAETYAFNPQSGLVDLDRFYVAHDQSIVGYSGELKVDRPVGRFANRFLAGVNLSTLNLLRPSFFTVANSVDPFNPTPGVFGALLPANQTADINTAAAFFEDYFPVRSDLKIAASLRTERLSLDREVFTAAGALNPGPSFSRTYAPVTWKTGVVYDARPATALYAHVASAADPVNTNLFVIRSGENFDLASGLETEAGVKQTLPRGLGEWTAAYYWIRRKNILTQTSATTADAVGRQSSRGFETSLDLRPWPRLQVQFNGAFVDAQYDEFDEVVGNSLVSRSGNTPFNSPGIVLGAWSSYRFGGRIPIEVGGSYRHVGDRFSTTDNSIRLLAYDLVDGFVTWTMRNYEVTGRIRNLFDQDYAAWSDNFYPTQVLLGAPRSAEIGLRVRF